MFRRSRLAPLGAAAVALLALAGCAQPNPAEAPDDSAPPAEEGAFPVSVETKFGTVEVAEQPERIVALGWGDAETALALDVQPVGASDWLGFGGEGVGPWADGLYDEAPEIIETLEPSYEAIAALEPDLILDTKGSGDQERYDRLTEIAPTIGVPEGGDDYLTNTEQQMTLVSQALGKAEEGEALLAEVDATITDAASAHPEWAGKTVSVATKTSEGWGAYIEGDERVTLLQQLGFAQNPSIAELETNATGFSVSLSNEQLDLLDADLVVAFPIFIETTALTGDPLWQAVPAVEDGHDVVIDDDLASAYSLGTTLSRTFAIEQLVPLIEKAVPA